MAGNKNSGNRGKPTNKTSTVKETAIINALKQGKGVLETAALTDTSKNVVQRVRNENADQLPVWQKKTAENMMRVHSKLLNTLEESIDNSEPSSKILSSISISLGILSDKLQNLQQTGQQTIEHKHIHINHSDVNLLLGDVKASNPSETSEKVKNTKENELFN